MYYQYECRDEIISVELKKNNVNCYNFVIKTKTVINVIL